MDTSADTFSWRVPALAVAGGILAALCWGHLVATPFWLDDHVFLYSTEVALAEGIAPWRMERWLPGEAMSWRPLSITLFWVPVVWGGSSAVAAHAYGLALLAGACAAVGSLAHRLARVVAGDVPPVAAFWAAFLYGVHGAFFLAIGFASATHELFALFFAALTLRAWLGALVDDPPLRERLLSAITPLLFAAALLSKESTALLPFLALAVAAMARRLTRPPARALIVAVACGIVGLAWFLVRNTVVVPPSAGSAYELRLGLNVPRNAVSLAAFLVNVPRESLRFLVESRAPLAGLWALACAGPMLAVGVLLARRLYTGRGGLPRLLPYAAFLLIGLLPYFFLAWNCYAYYTLLGLFVYPFAVALALARGSMPAAVPPLALASCLCVGLVAHALPEPGFLARAQTVQRLHAEIRGVVSTHPMPLRSLAVDADERLLADLGWEYGLSRSTGLPPEALYPADRARAADALLRIDADRISLVPMPSGGVAAPASSRPATGAPANRPDAAP